MTWLSGELTGFYWTGGGYKFTSNHPCFVFDMHADHKTEKLVAYMYFGDLEQCAD